MKYDGQVLLDARITTDDLPKDVKEVSGELGGLTNVLQKLGFKISDAMSKPITGTVTQIKKDIDACAKAIERYQAQIQKAQANKLPLMEQGKTMGAELDEAKAKLAELQARQAAAQKALQAPTDRPLNGREIEAYIDAQARLPQINEDLARQQDKVDALEEKWSGVCDKIDKYDLEINQAKQLISEHEKKADELADELKKAEAASRGIKTNSKTASTEMKKMNKMARGFGSRLKSIAMGALIFNGISAGLREVTSYFGKALKSNEAFNASLGNLKGALLTAFQPIYNFVAPALNFLVNLLTDIILVIAQLFAAIAGTTVEASSEAAKNLYEQAGALNDVDAAAQKAGKSLAGFDEISKLSEQNSGSANQATTIPSFNFSNDKSLEQWLEYTKKIMDEIGSGFSKAFSADIPKLKKSGKRLIETIKGIVLSPELVSAFEEFKTAAYTAFGSVLGALSSIVSSLSVGIVNGVDDALSRLEEFNKVKLESVTTNVTNIAEQVTNASKAIADIATVFEGEAFSGIIEFFTMLADVLVLEWLDAVTGYFSDLFSLFIQPLVDNGEKIKEALDKIAKIVNKLLEPAKELIDKFTQDAKAYEDSSIHSFFVELTQFASAGLGAALDEINTQLDGMLELINGEIDFSEWFNTYVAPAFSAEKWAGLLGEVKAGFETKWEEIKAWWNTTALGGLWNEVTSFFDVTNWTDLLGNVVGWFEQGFKDAANAAIKVLNDMIYWINQRLQFTIPELNLLGEQVWPTKYVTVANVPSIPYLAQGAVLPANKPFMAVVGDQRHGTNVEAPLSTIQEAVALVLADQMGGVMAGFNAVTERQEQILQAIFGLDVSDGALAAAVQRYQNKMAAVTGG